MLIPLGILAAAGAGGGPTSDYQLISTVFGTGSSSVITFSSIPQTFINLELRYSGRAPIASGTNIFLRMNGITSSSYGFQRLRVTSGSVGTSGSGNTANIFLENALDANASGVFCGGVISIFDYSNTSKNTTTRALYGSTDNTVSSTACLVSGVFVNTAAVSSLSITTANGLNFTSDSRFSLYGIKA
jgi:hypothetical protein